MPILSLLTASGFPAAFAQRKRVSEAILNRSPAVVKIPSPVKLIFMATALAPKSVQRKMVKSEAERPIGSWGTWVYRFFTDVFKIALRFFLTFPLSKQREAEWKCEIS